MPKLRVAVADPVVSAFSAPSGTLAVVADGDQRFLEVEVAPEPPADAPDDVKAAVAALNADPIALLRGIAAEHGLGEPVLVPDSAPASKAASASKPTDPAPAAETTPKE